MQPAYQAVGKEALMAKSEEVRKAFGGVWRFSFFLCAFLCVASGVLATICAVWSFLPPFDFINFVFLTLFGCVMLLQEAPVDNRYVELFRQTMHTYALALTRFTGKGCLYLFLGSMAFGALWDNDIAPFLGFILGGIIVAVAIASLIVGYRMTMQLEKVRQAVLAEGTEKWSAYIPPAGMTKQQFADMAQALKQVQFSEEELRFIISAFSFEYRADDVISKEEFLEWCNGPLMLL